VTPVSERITGHPILTPPQRGAVSFTFDGRRLASYDGEVISSALFAHGIHVFGTHEKDGYPQGIFCANGQCAQCLVLVDGRPMKACVTAVKEGMDVRSIHGLPELPAEDLPAQMGEVDEYDVDVLIIGGGPSGLSAALELGSAGVQVLMVDDKLELGGKLSLQTHNFFGSIKDCYAGSRGMDIGTMLSRRVEEQESVEVWLNSPAVGVFDDRQVGIVKDGVYTLVKPERLLVTTGARESTLAFPGCDLPGVYGAGAFQTLVNRDLVKPSSRLFIVGGGNVGLIGAYHALQAGIDVVGIVEALPQCGGYKVHLDKILRLGIPVWTSHTVLRAEGDGAVERVVTARIDRNFQPVPGTERTFDIDTLLIAVGLLPVNELLVKARESGMKTYSAGDADTIAEASAAIFSGKIVGRRILGEMGVRVDMPPQWDGMVSLLRAKPPDPQDMCAPVHSDSGVYPVIRCSQEIPCNPCTEACPLNSISIKGPTMSHVPTFEGACVGCGHCVGICPGLSIVLVDRRYDPSGERAIVTVPWELPEGTLEAGMDVETRGWEGEAVGSGKVVAMKRSRWQDRRWLVNVDVPAGEADLVAGVLYRNPDGTLAPASPYPAGPAEHAGPGAPTGEGGEVCAGETADITSQDVLDEVSLWNREGDGHMEGDGRMEDEGSTEDEGSMEDAAKEGAFGDDSIIVCRCERVTKVEIAGRIRDGCRDINALKAELRVGMGPCGGKTCMPLIMRIFGELGVAPEEVEPHVERPLTQEVPMSAFLGEVRK
jgi:NADPH-dependent 2,4-dienoyl-CoA reductase/sulfur reductase-like enzyme/Pyruvate/2-oxoacid:ferredoxin oxidoreductase delta subunit